jgi:hypothetical protein
MSLTRQYWKLAIGVAALVLGSLAPLVEATGISWTSGTIIAVVGYVFALVAVRCPGCGSRWFWQAALDASLYRPLFKGSSCPACKRDFGRASQAS